METFSLDVATEFLLIAATLIELKTRRLLPGEDDLDLDDELALWSERDLLLTRLVECKTFKEAAIALSALAGDASRTVGRTVGVDTGGSEAANAPRGTFESRPFEPLMHEPPTRAC